MAYTMTVGKSYKQTIWHFKQHSIQYHSNMSYIIQAKNIIQTQGYLIDHPKSNIRLSLQHPSGVTTVRDWDFMVLLGCS